MKNLLISILFLTVSTLAFAADDCASCKCNEKEKCPAEKICCESKSDCKAVVDTNKGKEINQEASVSAGDASVVRQ